MTHPNLPAFKLSPKQRDFLKQKLQQKKLGDPNNQSIKAQSIKAQSIQSQEQPADRSTPLSYAQEWMWLLEQIASPDYNNPMTIRLEGTLSIEALEQSLAEIVQRHSVLRTTLAMDDEGIKQITHPRLSLALRHVDISHLPEETQPEEAWKLIEQDRCKSFNLLEEPPIRLTLLHIKKAEKATEQLTENWLHITWHHIASDDTSFSIFMRELSALYKAFSQGKPSPLKALPIQYEDYALWQRQRVISNDWEKSLSFWRQHLQGGDSVLDLPKARKPRAQKTKSPKTGSASAPAAQVEFGLSVELTDQLKAFSRQHQVTLFTTLLSAFRTLLYRYTSQPNLRIGVPVSLRNHAELQDLIGVFINTLAIQLDVSDCPSSQVLLKRSQHTMATALDNKDIPFHKLVELLQSEESNFDANIPVIFDFQSVSPLKAVTDTLTLTPLDNKLHRVSVPLALHIEESAQDISQSSQIRGAFYFNPQEIDCDIVQSMAEHFHRVLQAMMAEPQTPITHLPLLSAAETHLLLKEWNNTQTHYPYNKCIHQLFEEQVARTPDAIAVVFEKEQLTYKALNKRANQLAHHLRALGIGPDVLVGICVEPSLDMIVGLLGILKAGGAYLPLDPAYPSDRIAYMMADAAVSILLTQQTLKTALPSHAAKVVCLDEECGTSSNYPNGNVKTSLTPENLAYAIYTSGSTGKPKGVLIQHQGLCNLAKAKQKLFQIAEGKRCLQSFSLSFDGSVWEIFPTLTAGATLYLVRKDHLLSGHQMARWLDKQAINIATMSPALLSTLPSFPLPHLEILVVGGEPCPSSLVEQWSVEGRRFFNAYGPTEATVCTTVSQIHSADQVLSIGRPIDNTQVFILDADHQLVPVGVPGELFIGGVGLARGYLNRPALTAERFIPHPFSDAPNARLYKTADLARYLPDGNIEILGRTDHQVKIRGFRIEPGEIEFVLGNHPQIKEAVVVVHTLQAGDKRLVAYLTLSDSLADSLDSSLAPQSDASLNTQELSHYLKDRLPAYMIPTAFVVLPAFPLTPSGKVDRWALPASGLIENLATNMYVAPRSPVEAKLTQIWQDLLKVEKIGIYDNFFELGGHSLLATQMISRIRAAFSIELPLRILFETPVIYELAEGIEALSFVQQNTTMAPAQVTEEREELEF